MDKIRGWFWWAAAGVTATALLAVWGAGALRAAPEPALVQGSGIWQLEFQLYNDRPEPITLQVPGTDEVRTYWYLLYQVTNPTAKAIDFYPRFELFTDRLQLSRGGVAERRYVYEAIRDRYAGTIPLMEPSAMVAGRVLVGQDNARDSVAVFEDFDPKATRLKLFVMGLSNETVTVASPVRMDPETNQPVEVLLRKTLALEYRVAGDPRDPGNRAMLYQSRDWVMR